MKNQFIIPSIIIVAGIAGIFEFMVKGALETPGGGGSESNFPDALNKHGVIYHACCEADPCCGMVNCCDLKEKKSGEACKNSNCVKISNEKKEKAAKKEIADLLRKHGAKTGKELKAEGK